MTSTITGVTTLSNKMGILGNSFSDIFNAYQGYGMAGVKNLFANTSDKIVTSMDIEMLKNFNNEIANGVPKTEALQNTMFGASKGARELALSANTSKEGLAAFGTKLQSLETTEQGYIATTIGARVATVAFQAALTFGIAIAIQGLITLFGKLKDAIPTPENTSKWLEESSKKVEETKNEVKSLNDELTTTRERIDELLSKDKLTIVEQNELNKLQLTEAQLKRNIDLLEKQAQVENRKNIENFTQSTGSYRNGFDKKVDNSMYVTDFGRALFPNDEKFTNPFYGESNEKMFERYFDIYKALQVDSEVQRLIAQGFKREKIDSYLKDSEEWMTNYTKKLRENLSALGEFEYDKLSDEAKAQVDYINDTLNAFEMLQGKNETVFSSIYNQERFSEGKKAIEELKESGKLTAETFEQLYNTNDNVKAMIDNMRSVGLVADTSSQSFELLTNQLVGTNNAFNSVANNINSSGFTIADEELQKQVDELKEGLSDIADTYSNLKGIIDDWNENGNLSIENLESLIGLGDEYVATLFNENGELELNKDSYVALAKAKLEDIRYSMLEKAISQINSLSKDDETRANATLAESTGNLTEETLKLVAAQKLAEGVSSSQINAIMQTYYQWSALIDNVVVGLEENTDATLGVSKSTDKATESSDAYKDSLEAEEKALEDAKEALEKQKSALEDMKNGYEDAIASIKELVDWVQNYIKQIKNDEIDALEKEKDKRNELIELRRKEIEKAKELKEEENELGEKINTVAKARLKAASTSLDDSSAGKKATKIALEESKKADKEYQDFLYEQRINSQLESLEEQKANNEKYYDEQIDKIKEYLDNEVQIYKDACAMIDNDNGELYGKLLWYCQTYTTISEAEFNHMWNSAQLAMEQYNTANLGTFELLNSLQGRIYEVDSAINTIADSISTYEDRIDGVKNKLDDLKDAAVEAKNAIDRANSTPLKPQVQPQSQPSSQPKSQSSSQSQRYLYTGTSGQTYMVTAKSLEEAVSYFSKNIKSPFLLDTDKNRIRANIRKYATGTRSTPSAFISQEKGLEAIFAKNPNGSGSYTLTTPDSQVFDHKRTDNLYDFSGNPEEYLRRIFERGLTPLSSEELIDFGLDDISQIKNRNFVYSNLDGLVEKLFNTITVPQNTTNSVSPVVNITIQGDATQSTVNALRAEANNIIAKATKASHDDFIETVLKGRKWR